MTQTDECWYHMQCSCFSFKFGTVHYKVKEFQVFIIKIFKTGHPAAGTAWVCQLACCFSDCVDNVPITSCTLKFKSLFFTYLGVRKDNLRAGILKIQKKNTCQF